MAKLGSLLLLTILPMYSTLAQENSVDEYTGSWTDDATWQDSSAPATSNIEGTININGLVSAPSLAFKPNSASLFIDDSDTLIVDGNMSMSNENGISVGNGAVLVVIGDFDANNFLTVANGGIIVVLGSFTVNTDANVFNSGSIYLLGGHNLEDDDFPGGTVADNVDGADSLVANEEDLVLFLDENYGTTLPIELIYFSVNPASEGVILEWATASEQNNAYFIIERASSNMSFQEVEKVEGKGNSSQVITYKTVDSHPDIGMQYYRLKQVDANGNYEYHPAVAVWVESHSDLLVIPNPSKDGVYQCKVTEPIHEARYIDMSGKNYQGTVAKTNNISIVSPQHQLRRGYYIIRLQTANQIYMGNLIIE